MAKRTIARYITVVGIIAFMILAFWDIWLKFENYRAFEQKISSLSSPLFLLYLFILIVLITVFSSKPTKRVWNIIFWPFISDSRVKPENIEKCFEYSMPRSDVVGLTYIGGDLGRTFYLDKNHYCNIRIKDGAMQVITGPKVAVKSYGSDVVSYDPTAIMFTD